MPERLYVSLDFLHLENALFYAEQCIAGGIEFLEIGSVLLKNTGFNSIRIFKERFPSIKIVCDLKIIQPQALEIEEIAKLQIHAITLSGAISEKNYNFCLSLVKKHSLKIYLDFRGCSISVIQNAIPFIHEADAIILDFFPKISSSLSLFQQISSLTETPIFIQTSIWEESAIKSISTFSSNPVISIQEGTSLNVKELIAKIKNTLVTLESQVEVRQKRYNEESLLEKLRRISTVHICEVCKKPAFLEKVYPLHRFTKIIGRAYTIKVWPGEQKQVIKYLMEIPEQSILVVDAGGSTGNAVWSSLSTEIAMKRKIAGVVIYGAISDVPHLRQKGFPCYAASLTAIPGKQDGFFCSNISLNIGNVTIEPGDWLMGDDNGIVCIPFLEAFPIVDRAFELAKNRESILEEVSTLESLTKDSIESLLARYYQNTEECSGK